MERKPKSFIHWLKKTTGDSQDEMAAKLKVSSSLISRYASGERRPTELLVERIAETYGLSLELVRFQVEQTLESNGWTDKNGEDSAAKWKRQALELESKLLSLKEPRMALRHALSGVLPAETIDKLADVIALEIKYAQKQGGEKDAD